MWALLASRWYALPAALTTSSSSNSSLRFINSASSHRAPPKCTAIFTRTTRIHRAAVATRNRAHALASSRTVPVINLMRQSKNMVCNQISGPAQTPFILTIPTSAKTSATLICSNMLFMTIRAAKATGEDPPYMQQGSSTRLSVPPEHGIRLVLLFIPTNLQFIPQALILRVISPTAETVARPALSR